MVFDTAVNFHVHLSPLQTKRFMVYLPGSFMIFR